MELHDRGVNRAHNLIGFSIRGEVDGIRSYFAGLPSGPWVIPSSILYLTSNFMVM